MKKTAFALAIVAGLTLTGTAKAGHRDHARLHDELQHRSYHRDLEHRDAHRRPLTWWGHERLHDDLEHDAYHDRLEHRSAHPSYPRDVYAPRGFGFGGHGFSIWFGR